MPGTLEHHLKVLVDRLDLDLVVDVGAFRGEFGKMIRRCGFDGPIVSYDPTPAPELAEVTTADGRWQLRPLACGSTSTIATFHTAGHEHPLNSFHREAHQGFERFGHVHTESREVEVVRVDAEQLDGSCVFLKTDAQAMTWRSSKARSAC
jgi:FkbM family methyltransferase